MLLGKTNHFKDLGYMVDCSRGAVPKVESLKRLITILKEFGYTYIMLYTEDVYEIDGEPYFGYMRGRYSKKEIKEIDTSVAINRELAIIKVKAIPESRLELLTVANTFGAKVVDLAADTICFEKTGESNKLDSFIELLKPYGIVEMCRTGIVAIDRGSTTLKK